MRDRTGAANHLNAENRILVDIGGRRELGDDLGPVGVHLIGQDHGQGSVNSLTELQPVHLDNDLAVRPDVNERIGRIGRVGLRRRRLASFLGERRQINVERHQQPAGGGSGYTKEDSPVQVQAVVGLWCKSQAPPPLLQLL